MEQKIQKDSILQVAMLGGEKRSNPQLEQKLQKEIAFFSGFDSGDAILKDAGKWNRFMSVQFLNT